MTAAISELPRDERPLSEQFRIVAKKYAEADNKAYLADEMKTTVLAQKKAQQIKLDAKLSDAAAEREVKASLAWEKYIREMCAHRAEANRLRLQLKYIEMLHREWISKDANARKEMGL